MSAEGRPGYQAVTSAVSKVRGFTLLLQAITLWRCIKLKLQCRFYITAMLLLQIIQKRT